MIIYRITDGLGNQLHQYATARALAHRLGDADLLLDRDTFYVLEADDFVRENRPFLLDRYRLRIRGYADREQIHRLSGYPRGDFAFPLRLMWWRFRRRRGNRLPMIALPPSYFMSRDLWDPRVLGLTGDRYIQAFGQHWEHLRPIEAELRDELTVADAPTGRNLELHRTIDGCEAVSIHVRRGDYVTHGYSLCSPRYYENAIAFVRARVTDPRFFVFTDDPEWSAREFGGLEGAVVVAHNGPGEAHEDMRLMSACRTNIIANSSFSWWGAWLNDAAGKLVVAPSAWKRGESSETKFPPEWHTVDG